MTTHLLFIISLYNLLNIFIISGSSSDEQNGFIGCIRAFMLNGQLVDLKSYAEKRLYGISPGCIGKCDSNPCLNNGTCFEKYDGYTCDCRWTAFKGPICADGKYNFKITFLKIKCYEYTVFYYF